MFISIKILARCPKAKQLYAQWRLSYPRTAKNENVLVIFVNNISWFFEEAVISIGWLFFKLFPPVFRKVMVSSTFHYYNMDIDLVYCEIVYVAFAVIRLPKRLFKIS